VDGTDINSLTRLWAGEQGETREPRVLPVGIYNLVGPKLKDGQCPKCGQEVIGVW
jgi:hypothetical protein